MAPGWTSAPKVDPSEDYLKVTNLDDVDGWERYGRSPNDEEPFYIVVADSAAAQNRLPDDVADAAEGTPPRASFVDYGHPFVRDRLNIYGIIESQLDAFTQRLDEAGYEYTIHDETGFWPEPRATAGEVRVHDC